MIKHIKNIYLILYYLILKLNISNGDWGLGIGDWGLGIGHGPNPQIGRASCRERV